MQKIACIASIPERKLMLMETIKSLLPQVDHIALWLNNYIPADGFEVKAMDVDRIHFEIGDNRFGDAGKFYSSLKLENTYIFTCDDDLVFPSNYTEYMVSKIEEYKRKAVVSFHGRNLNLPITRYYHEPRQYYLFNKEIKKDVPVHVIGTGCMAYHSDTIKLSIDDFPSANMADVHFSIVAHKKKVPLMVVKHRASGNMYMSPEVTIYSQMKDDDSEQVQRLKEIEHLLY